jgi:hypothetical protein
MEAQNLPEYSQYFQKSDLVTTWSAWRPGGTAVLGETHLGVPRVTFEQALKIKGFSTESQALYIHPVTLKLTDESVYIKIL